jgi:hypothetical protein
MMSCHSRLVFGFVIATVTPAFTISDNVQKGIITLSTRCFNMLWSHSGTWLSVFICREPNGKRQSSNTKADVSTAFLKGVSQQFMQGSLSNKAQFW